jgi:hypothetical protein
VCAIYALCNGRRLTVWDREHFDPILDLEFAQFEASWHRIEGVLSPTSVLKPFMRGFLPDLGMSATKAGYADETDWFWSEFPVGLIVRVTDDLYTASAGLTSVSLWSADDAFLVSLDFSSGSFRNLLDCMPAPIGPEVTARLSRQPYQVQLADPVKVAVAAHLGERTRGEHEEFVPFVVAAVRPAILDPTEMFEWIRSIQKGQRPVTG